jgi:hypothetical protein
MDRTPMGRTLPFSRDHIPEVANLMWKFVYGQEGPAPAALQHYLLHLFFLSPWCDRNMPSWVYEDTGENIVGFLGVLVRRMALDGRHIRVAFGSGYIVHPESRATPAALRLVHAFFSGDQDLSLTDTANSKSQAIWGGFGGSVAPSFATHWSRPLRPCTYASHALARRAGNGFVSALAHACEPICKLGDAISSKIFFNPSRPDACREETLDIETLIADLSDSASSYLLRPAYDSRALRWLLDFMDRMKGYGELRKTSLRNGAGDYLGCYIYYLRSDRIAEVVHIGAKNGSFPLVFDHLLHNASAHGAIGVNGKLDSRIAQQVSRKKYLVYNGKDPLLVHSRDAKLTQLFLSGQAFFSRLDGEWCLRFGGDTSDIEVPVDEPTNPRTSEGVVNSSAVEISSPQPTVTRN